MAVAFELALRKAAPERNGRVLPVDVEWDLAVLRAAAAAASGFAGVLDAVSRPSDLSPSRHVDLVDVSEVARVLDVTVQYARRLCRRGRFETACRDGREWRVSAAEFAAFAAEREARSA